MRSGAAKLWTNLTCVVWEIWCENLGAEICKCRQVNTWRSLGDSNPCFRRERATSWAARRRERQTHEIALICLRCKRAAKVLAGITASFHAAPSAGSTTHDR